MSVFFLESDNYVENIDMFQELDSFIESVYTHDIQSKDLMIECIKDEYSGIINESASNVWESIKNFFKKIWQFCKDLLAKVKKFFSKFFKRNKNTEDEIKKTENEIVKIESKVKNLPALTKKISSPALTKEVKKQSSVMSNNRLDRTKYEKYNNPKSDYSTNLHKPKSVDMDFYSDIGRKAQDKKILTFNKEGKFLYQGGKMRRSVAFISKGVSYNDFRNNEDNIARNFYSLTREYDKLISYGKSIKNVTKDDIEESIHGIASYTKDINDLLQTDTKIKMKVTVRDLTILRNNFSKFSNQLENKYKPYEAAINQLRMFAEEGLKEYDDAYKHSNSRKQTNLEAKQYIVASLNLIVSSLGKINTTSAKIINTLDADLRNLSKGFKKHVDLYYKSIKEYK